MMSPIAYSGLSESNAKARPNISSGPTTQFWTSQSASTFVFRKTSVSRSQRTFASGGYIMRMSPAAIGIDAVPTESRVMAAVTEGATRPNATPSSMARIIQSVR
jgi:hypothetical protein